ncbi:restriction endonuclease subunit S [Bifidobacterium pseudolongum]|uniref:restriction endonuclease subunit S n=1 Tax=Bifidobacterium pseudolongum TaxID=1694 RepID=UPI0023F1365F|nr:restriction endonuclease subunit S [Bifidobacterium pseudolongum]MCH4842671.1 restriction endonuclease subunit S [Bifidobacterium pseudolongum]
MIELGRCHAVNAWEQRKLKDLIIKGGSGGTPNSRIKKYYIGNIPFLNISDISTRNIQDSEKHISKQGMESCSAWLVPAGSISLAMYASVGKVGVLMKPMATSQAFYNLCFNDESLRNYVYSRLEKAQIYSEWNPYISTGTQSNLNAKKVLNFILEIPEPEEVEQIGKLFTILDALIDAEKRKLDLLKDKKTALLRQIFDQKARFKGYTDPWEQRKLGDILSYEQPYEYIVSSDDYSPVARTPVLTAGKTLILGYTNEADGIKAVTKDSPVIIFDDFTASSHIIDYSFKIKSSAMKILSLRDSENDLYCIYYALTRIIRPSASHERQWISKYARATVTIPSKDEQQVIGDFLRKLDRLIAAESRKIDLLELKKKALLQQMFV